MDIPGKGWEQINPLSESDMLEGDGTVSRLSCGSRHPRLQHGTLPQSGETAVHELATYKKRKTTNKKPLPTASVGASNKEDNNG